MCRRALRPSFRSVATLTLLAALAACGGKLAADPNDREIAWVYGPRNGTATTEHLQGSGHEGGAPIVKGWHCRLKDQKRLTVQPYQLASSHPLFGKVVLGIGLYDKTGKDLGAVVSTAVTPQNANFTFELAADVATQLWDLVIWYRKV